MSGIDHSAGPAAHLAWLETHLPALAAAVQDAFAEQCIGRSLAELDRATEVLGRHGFGGLPAQLRAALAAGRVPPGWAEPAFDDRGDLASCPWHLAGVVWFQVTNFLEHRRIGEPRAAHFVAHANLDLVEFLRARWLGMDRAAALDLLLADEIARQRAFLEGHPVDTASHTLFGGHWFPRPGDLGRCDARRRARRYRHAGASPVLACGLVLRRFRCGPPRTRLPEGKSPRSR